MPRKALWYQYYGCSHEALSCQKLLCSHLNHRQVLLLLGLRSLYVLASASAKMPAAVRRNLPPPQVPTTATAASAAAAAERLPAADSRQASHVAPAATVPAAAAFADPALSLPPLPEMSMPAL
jgi:hypothetical protein